MKNVVQSKKLCESTVNKHVFSSLKYYINFFEKKIVPICIKIF